MEISTRNLEAFPNVVRLKRLLQSMAMLDAILMPEWQYRYYSFNAHWGQGEMMGSMRNGQGDELFALFNIHGAFLKGFVHESGGAAIPSENFYRDLPVQFEPCSREPAFSPDEVTFCVWRLIDQPRWSCSMVNLSAHVVTPTALLAYCQCLMEIRGLIGPGRSNIMNATSHWERLRACTNIGR